MDGGYLSAEKRHSGIANYIYNLLEALAGHPTASVRVLVTDDADLPEGVERVRITRRARAGRPSVYEHEIRRAGEMLHHRADVFHNPSPWAPALRPGPWIETLHDVIPLAFDDPELAAWKKRFTRFGPRYAKAEAVVAVSRHAADEGINYLGIPADRITVIPHGVDPAFHPEGRWEPADPPYISFVGEYSRRKGLADALEVIGQVAEAGLPHRMLVVGRVDPSLRADFERDLARAPRRDRVDLAGFVPDLAGVYRRASAHLITSRYEGFGLPALEAMACGTLVVSYANTSLSEVVGDGGLLVPDGSPAAAASALIDVLRSEQRRAEIADAGLARASRFTWKASARAHAEVYESIGA